jgi:RNA polymerase sigma factor (sigma-70 family)
VIVGGETGGNADPILLPFLSAADETEAEDHLVDLLAHHAMPIIEDVVGANLGPVESPKMECRVSQAQDVEDIVSEVILKILDRLRRYREEPEEAAIGDFKGYVKVAASNACNSYYRTRFPNRARFKDRLRYVLTHRREFALWETEERKLVCGFVEWRDQHRLARSYWIEQVRMQWEGVEAHSNPDDLTSLLGVAFAGAQAPIPFEDLLNGTAEILKITDDAPDSNHLIEQIRCSNLAAEFTDPVEAGAQRQYMKRLWFEIQQLRAPQRIALLLSIRDESQTSLTVLLSEICIASIREIADAVGMSVAEFVCVLQELPMDDNAISKRLGVSRQQVISYRLSARRRLEKRMKTVGSRERDISTDQTEAGDSVR